MRYSEGIKMIFVILYFLYYTPFYYESFVFGTNYKTINQ
jgi:hypothetical protein